MRYAKRDHTHKEIAQAFVACGCLVYHVDGAIDMVVFDPQSGLMKLVDAKTPRAKGGSDKQTDTQKEMLADGWDILFLRSAENAIEAVTRWRTR